MVVRVGESDGAADTSSQSVREVLDEQGAKALLDVDCKLDGGATVRPVLDAEDQGVLEDFHRSLLGWGG